VLNHIGINPIKHSKTPINIKSKDIIFADRTKDD
jgi:hypothetical protein